jgi:hypothetical protein
LFEDSDTVLASTSVALEIVGSVFRADQSKIPGIFRGAREAVWAERRSEPEKCSQWCGDDQAVGVALSICFVEPRRSGNGRPRRDVPTNGLRHGRPDWRRGHRAEPVQASGRHFAEESATIQMELQRHASEPKGVTRRSEAHDARRHVDEHACASRSRHARRRPVELAHQLGPSDHAMLTLDQLQKFDLDHSWPVGDHSPKTETPPEIRSDHCVQRNICSEFRAWARVRPRRTRFFGARFVLSDTFAPNFGLGGSGGEAEVCGGAFGFGSGGFGEVVAATGVEDCP